LRQINARTDKIDVEHSRVVEKNRGLAPTVISLAREVKAAKDDAVGQLGIKEELEEATEDAVEAKRRWRIMKSVVAAAVVGSGIDWASEEGLRELVLDDETVDGIE